MVTPWKIVQTDAKTEIWLQTGGSGPLIYGVTRGPKEPLNVSPGTEIYGIDKDLFDLFFDPVIRPVLEEQQWDLEKM